MKQRNRIMQNGDDMFIYDVDNNKKNDGEDDVQLHKIKSPEHFIEAQVQEGDTLQAIALRFYCSVSELKRINQIHKDNEIYARRTLKVPVTPYSVLTESLPSSTANAPSSSQNSTNLQTLLDTDIPEAIPGNNIATEVNMDCNAIVLNSTVAPSVTPYVDEITEPITEDTKLLPKNTKNKECVETVVVKQLTLQGADFGLKWYHLLCCVLILGVIIPIVYIMFYLDKPEHEEIDDLPPLPST